jgi:hypothetical protein
VLIVIGYLYLRKSPEPKKNTESKEINPLSLYIGPEIILGDMYSEYLPGKTESYDIEGYNIEYDPGDTVDYKELSKKVNISFQWANRAGFDNIDKFVFKRYVFVESTTAEGETVTTATNTYDDIIINKNEDTKQYFYNFYPDKDGSGNQIYHKITFNGVNLPEDNTISLVGTNAIVMYYAETDENNVEKLVPLTPETDQESVPSVIVSADKMTQALDSYKSIIDVFPPKIRQGSDIKVTSDIQKIGYFISTGNNENVIQQYISSTYLQSQIYMIPQSGNKSMKLKFEHNGTEKFIKFEKGTVRGGSFSVVDSINDATPFNIVKEEVDEDTVVIRYKFKYTINNNDYYMTLTKDTNNTDKLVMLTEDEIDTSDEYKNLIIKFRGYGDTNCELERSDSTGGDEWKTSGEKTYEFKVIKNPIGTGKCTYTDDLGTSYDDVTVDELNNGSFERTLPTNVDCQLSQPNTDECSDSNNGINTKTWIIEYMPQNNGAKCDVKYSEISSATFDETNKRYEVKSTCDQDCKGGLVENDNVCETTKTLCIQTGPGPGTQRITKKCPYIVSQKKWNNGNECPYKNNEMVTVIDNKSQSCF